MVYQLQTTVGSDRLIEITWIKLEFKNHLIRVRKRYVKKTLKAMNTLLTVQENEAYLQKTAGKNAPHGVTQDFFVLFTVRIFIVGDMRLLY